MELHICRALRGYTAPHAGRLHMPGHKGDGLRFPLCFSAPSDITELPFSDALEDPCGVIAAAQEDIAAVLGADFACILTDGSSSGVYAMVRAAGAKKLLLPRDAHKSAYNACALLGVSPVILENEVYEGAWLPPSPASVERALREHKGAAVLLTSPGYYGGVCDLAALRRICDAHKAPLLIDGAHGAFMPFDAACAASYAGRFADLWVDGSHKTMPTFTQGALLCGRAAWRAAAEEAVQLFRTTSPSYPVMASVEYGVKYMAEEGAALCAAVREDRAAAEALLKEAGIRCFPSRTLSLAVDLAPAGISPRAMAKALEQEDIWCELEDGRYLLAYNSPLTPPGALFAFAKAVLAHAEGLRGEPFFPPLPAHGEAAVGYLQALSAPYELVPLAAAEGRVAARNAGVTPPCYPVVTAGERITAAAVRALAGGAHTFGVAGGRIAVIEEGYERNVHHI